MIFLPLVALLLFVIGLVSLALLGGGIYLAWAWFAGTLTGTLVLVSGIVMLLLSLLGRPIVLFLFRRAGEDEPKAARDGAAQVQQIRRPDGTVLHVEVYGPRDGQPIVFTHGWGPNSTEWYYAKRLLANRFRLIVWDLPGLGKSSRPVNNDFSLEKMAADLGAVLSLAEGRPAILVGHSIGGMIQLTFCRLFPQHLGRSVAGIVELNTTYTQPLRTITARGFLQAIQKPVLEPLMHLMIWLFPVFWAMNWLSYFNGTAHILTMFTGFAGTESRGQLDYATLYTPMHSPAVLARGVLAMFRFDETATLPAIDVPVLVIAGDVDRATIPEAGAQMASRIPTAELITLSPAGHMSNFERNAEVMQAIGSFSQRTGYAHALRNGLAPDRTEVPGLRPGSPIPRL